MSAAEAVAAAVLDACGVEHKPPIDLRLLATRLGVDEVIETQLLEDGRLEHSPDRTRILLKAGVSRVRRRFTLAHELGHLVCHGHDAPLIARRAVSVADDEERFCDAFAAAILLPRTFVGQIGRDRPQDLATLRLVSEACDTSLAAACVRLREVAGWRQSLLRWRHDFGRWRFVAGAGVPHKIWGRVRGTAATDSLLDGARTAGEVWADVPVLIDGAEHRVPGVISVRGNTAVALVDLGAR